MPLGLSKGVGTLLGFSGGVLATAGLWKQWASPGTSPAWLIAGEVLSLCGAVWAYVRKDAKGVRLCAAGCLLGLLGLGGWWLHGLCLPWVLKTFGGSRLVTEGDIMGLRRLVTLLPAGVAGVAGIVGVSSGWQTRKDEAKPPVPPTRKQALDVEICRSEYGPVVIKHIDRYLHTLVVGTTGTGKTSRVLKPMVWQDLLAIKEGKKLGITVIEPKGDFAQDVAEMCRQLNIPVVHINPEDPASPKFNPLEGEAETVAEIMRTVLRSLFGKQEAFFRQNQELAARNTALLVKHIKGDDATMLDMLDVLRDENLVERYVAILERVEAAKGKASGLPQYFRTEILGKMKEKSFQFITGLRLQLDDIVGNAMLRRVLIGKSDIDLDRHLAEGGVMVVSTAMGSLGKLGDAFGQFVMMHFQQAVFRRPGNERTRTPHVLYVDEFPRYVNADFEKMLAIGRSYRCATVLALQTTAQIELEDKKVFKDIVLETCRNKVILNLGAVEDAKRFSAEFGEILVTDMQKSYHRDQVLLYPMRWDGAREERKYERRFPYTFLMEMPRYKAVVRIVRDGEPTRPVLGTVDLSPFDKQRRRRRTRVAEGRLEVEVPAVGDGGIEVDFGARDDWMDEPFFGSGGGCDA